jgi:hypothetical protein
LANPLVGGVAAAYLVGLPTYYTLFPPGVSASGDTSPRGNLFLLWIVVAVISTLVTASHSRTIERLVARRENPPPRDAVLQLGAIAADWAIGSILGLDPVGAPRHYQWTLYHYDSGRDRLVPSYPPETGQADVRIFRRGHGATGLAYQTGAMAVATGDSVSDGSYGLTKAQQTAFREYRVVAAAPVKAGGFAIGAVTAISREDDGFFETEAGAATMSTVAQACGELLLVSRPWVG